MKSADIGVTGNGPIQPVRVDKLLVKTGLADSVSDGQRKIKQHAVKIDGDLCSETSLSLTLPGEFVVRVGRQIKRVRIEP